MREALTRSDFDAVRRTPAPKRGRKSGLPTQSSRAKPSGSIPSHLLATVGAFLASAIAAGSMLTGRLLLMVVRRHPVAVFGGLVGVAVAASIIINAISLQEGHHPSPMFVQGQAPKAAASKVALPKTITLTPDSASLPPPRPVSGSAPVTAASPVLTKAIAPPAPTTSPSAANDPIALLLASGAPPQPAKAVQSGIITVQQALVKLGYAIIPDGRTGPATQQAIAAFEKIEDLPITGDPMNTAMRKALSVASGMALN